MQRPANKNKYHVRTLNAGFEILSRSVEQCLIYASEKQEILYPHKRESIFFTIYSSRIFVFLYVSK